METIIEIDGKRYKSESIHPELKRVINENQKEFSIGWMKFELIKESQNPDTMMTIDLKEFFPFLGTEISNKKYLHIIKETIKDFIVQGILEKVAQ